MTSIGPGSPAPLGPPADAPVAVLGAGPVGQTAALLLARWGLPVVLLDARPHRDAVGSKAICQQRDVLDVWDGLGAGAIAAEGVTWTSARTYYRGTEVFAHGFAERGRSPLPPFVNISQSRTEQILDELIAATPAIDMRWDHRVVGLGEPGGTAGPVGDGALGEAGGGVAVRCATRGGTVQLRASHVVAATGARDSAVRDALGVRFTGRTFGDQFLICDIRADLPGWERERRFYFDPAWNPGRQVLIHPCPDSTYRIDWQVPPGFDLAAEEASGALDRRVRQVVGSRPYKIVWRSVYRFQSRIASRMQVGRVLLAGDCAHLMAPFGARGLNSGVQDAENAAWKIAFIRRGLAGAGLLASYHDERHAAAAENLAVTDATMRFLVPPDAAARAYRRAVLEAALSDPAARDRVDSGRLAEPFWYGDSPLTTPDPARPAGGRPPKGQAPPPAPGVLVPDAPVRVPGRAGLTRLTRFAREGVTLLLAGEPAGPGGPGGPAGAGGPAGPAGPGGPAGAGHGGLPPVTPAGASVPELRAGPVAVRMLRLADADPSGTLAAALGARPGEAWLVRPDAHVAAIVPATFAAVAAAVRRMIGAPAPAVPPGPPVPPASAPQPSPHRHAHPRITAPPEGGEHGVLPAPR